MSLDEVQNIVSSPRISSSVRPRRFQCLRICVAVPESDQRGYSVLDCTTGLSHRSLNRGSASTCLRYQGETIVDLFFANALAAHGVSGWRFDDVEKMSDHVYIRIDASTALPTRPTAHHQMRWALKGMDEDDQMAAVLAVACAGIPCGPVDVNAETHCSSNVMASISDVPIRSLVYWWSNNIQGLRTDCGVARRQYTRARHRRNNDAVRTAELYTDYRALTKQLQLAISSAKPQAWDRLLSKLREDPWDRPYKLLMDVLRPWAPPLMETMDPPLLERVRGRIFPSGVCRCPLTPSTMLHSHRHSAFCEQPAETGTILLRWKTGRMVLLRKDNKSRRLVRHLSCDGSDLAECQFGFRESNPYRTRLRPGEEMHWQFHSTSRIPSTPSPRRPTVGHSKVTRGPFNCGWWTVITSGQGHRFSGRNGSVSREIKRRVLQRSVLGPLLWNVGYNAALQSYLPVGVHLTCSADDTMLLLTIRALSEPSEGRSGPVSVEDRVVRRAAPKLPPLELLTLEDAYFYWRLRLGGISSPPGEMTSWDEFRRLVRRSTISNRHSCAESDARRTRGERAVLPLWRVERLGAAHSPGVSCLGDTALGISSGDFMVAKEAAERIRKQSRPILRHLRDRCSRPFNLRVGVTPKKTSGGGTSPLVSHLRATMVAITPQRPRLGICRL
ncbi:uncharacterized protein LOC143433138 [Xylocopa sonorina]|uniref:uncharacterized protein LOC143433138 n=1 Tax=Xylocopa sonorina TaxID=1818115 RepID=UPI00403AA742